MPIKSTVFARGSARSHPLFDAREPSLDLTSTKMGYREAFYHFVNIEEHPETLPLAYGLVSEHFSAADDNQKIDPAATDASDIRALLENQASRLSSLASNYTRPWKSDTADLTRRQVLHYYTQYLPTALVDGCWLQGGCRVATAHTQDGATMTGLYQHQLRAFVEDPGRHFVADYRAVFERLGAQPEEISSRSFAQRIDLHEKSLSLPLFLLGVASFTSSFTGEIFGINFAWQHLGLSSIGPDLIEDACQAYGLPKFGEDLIEEGYLDTGRRMAMDAALGYITSGSKDELSNRLYSVQRGIESCLNAWELWFAHLKETAPSGPPNPRQEMLDMLWRKAPHAQGYHGKKRLGAKKIDEHLDQKAFDGPALLDALAQSAWVKAGKADKSMILTRLIEFGGPMLAVFSPVEKEIIANWIQSLPEDGSEEKHDLAPASVPSNPEELFVEGQIWAATQYKERSYEQYKDCSVRELYHYLVNVETHPDILPVAERFASNRLERSMAMLRKGERPIPTYKYDPDALEQWVYKKHRDQVAAYRPIERRPPVDQDAFIETTTQLAPLILIDGGWLQGIASPSLIHTTVGRMLFHVLVEEIGEGNNKEHHANVYRELLSAMGEAPPPVESWEFARWDRLHDESFDVPALWLSMSCFPRHFLPEILGLNLAVELAGVGGPYMEARDTLRQFRYPTTFVDVHNAADNVSVGHAAWAMNSIRRYIDMVADREGPSNVDRVWHRVWSGVRATMPQIGRYRLAIYRVRRRLFGEDPKLIPLIFPSSS